MNKYLEGVGLQTKTNGVWNPTDAANSMYAKHGWVHKNKSE